MLCSFVLNLTIICNRLSLWFFQTLFSSWKHTPTKLFISLCWFLSIKFRFGETFTFIDFVTRINLELLNLYLPFNYTCMFQFSGNSNVLRIPPSFLAFLVLLIFAVQPLKISEICTLFRQIRLIYQISIIYVRYCHKI